MFFCGRPSWVQGPDKGIRVIEESVEKNKIYSNRSRRAFHSIDKTLETLHSIDGTEGVQGWTTFGRSDRAGLLRRPLE